MTLEERMASGRAFTFRQLCESFPGEGGRHVDRAIRRWKELGWIASARMKGETVWQLTEHGIEATTAIRPSSD